MRGVGTPVDDEIALRCKISKLFQIEVDELRVLPVVAPRHDCTTRPSIRMTGGHPQPHLRSRTIVVDERQFCGHEIGLCLEQLTPGYPAPRAPSPRDRPNNGV